MVVACEAGASLQPVQAYCSVVAKSRTLFVYVNMFLRHSLRRLPFLARYNSTKSDIFPEHPTWSVKDLLSSYPKPTLSSATLNRLHQAAALIPPAQGTPEHDLLKEEMEELVRLVEAVKLVDTSGVELRGWKNRDDLNQVDLTVGQSTAVEETEGSLMQHAARSVDGMYVVDADKPRTSTG